MNWKLIWKRINDIITVVVVCVVILFIALVCWANHKVGQMRSTAISVMSSEGFVGERFCQLVNHAPVKLQANMVDEEMLYFSIPKAKYTKDNVLQMSTDPKAIQVGKWNSEKSGYVLGTLVYSDPKAYFFRIPWDKLAIKTDEWYKFRLGNYQYMISLDELNNLLEDKGLYGTEAGSYRISEGNGYDLPNHGYFVAKKGEPSLQRLVAQMLRGAKSNEERAQVLLDFVSGNIKYDWQLAGYSGQAMQRPNEVLMKGSGSCSGKSILYASLLEQVDIPYYFFYTPEHITVCVVGKFANNNKLAYNIGKDVCSVAETTAKNFVIGESRINTEGYVVDFFQRPSDGAPMTKDGRGLK